MIVPAAAMAIAVRAVVRLRVLAPGGCCPVQPTLAASTPRMRTLLAMHVRPEIADHREIVGHLVIAVLPAIAVHQEIHALITAVQGRPWATVRPLASVRKVRPAQVRAREARAGESARHSVHGQVAMRVEGQVVRVHKAEVLAVLVGPTVAMAGLVAAMAASARGGVGPDLDAVVGMSRRCQKFLRPRRPQRPLLHQWLSVRHRHPRPRRWTRLRATLEPDRPRTASPRI